mmetsp:Transcript_55074/g.59679  ORF Transcript_55074/g.59679 Transcript_55074/m.59679 type:complete len:248 (+) Transcript_55074:3269-4012(+)
MRLPLKYQIIVLIILILPCLGFTISPFGRTTTTITETVKSLSQRNHVFFASTSDSTGNVNSDNEEEEDDDDDDDNNDYTKTVSVSILSEVPLWKRVVFFYKYKKTNDDDDGLTFKQKLANMGLSALLSYGFVSNMSYCVSVGLAWFGFSKQTGLSPLAPGQWKKFLAVYAGFYVFNNIVRPIRLAISVGVTPYFDKAVARVQRKTGLKKSLSIGIVVFLANICGTTSLMGLAIWIASIAAGVPIRSK